MQLCQVAYDTFKSRISNFAATHAVFNTPPRGIKTTTEPYPIQCRAVLIRHQGGFHPTPWPFPTASNRTRQASRCAALTDTKPYLGYRPISNGFSSGSGRPRNITNRMRSEGETKGKLRFRYHANFIFSQQFQQTIPIRFATASHAAVIRPSRPRWSKTPNCRP